METTPEDDPGYDHRTAEQIRYDAMSDQVREAAASVLDLAKIVKELASNGNTTTQRVIYKSEGMGAIGILCAAICALCVVFVIVEFHRQDSATITSRAEVDGKLRDLDAWRSQHSREIDTLKFGVKQLQEEKKK